MTAGYSGTPLPQRLGIKPGHRVALLSAPPGFAESLALPGTVSVVSAVSGRAPLNVAVLFVQSSADLLKRFDAVASRLDPAGGFWVAWPKKSSGVKTDLTEDRIREIALAAGLVGQQGLRHR
jgi:hypothetical protein